jgi:hypothetical protein
VAEQETTQQTLQEALEETDRRLRRIVRRLNEGEDPQGEAFEKEVKGARRQLRMNRELLGWSPSGSAEGE